MLCGCCLTRLFAGAQFTEAQQKEQLAKLALARQALATAPATKRFKFISAVNSQVPCRSLFLRSAAVSGCACACAPFLEVSGCCMRVARVNHAAFAAAWPCGGAVMLRLQQLRDGFSRAWFGHRASSRASTCRWARART